MAAGLQVLAAVAPKINFAYEVEAKHFGGAAIDAELVIRCQKQP
jgi:3-isopropylmalate dehydrogenase